MHRCTCAVKRRYPVNYMSILNLENINLAIGEREILKDISVGMEPAERIGVIGINGAGKSTLLAIIAGMHEPDSGNVIKQNGLRVSYLPQEPKFNPKLSVLDNVASVIHGKEAHWDTEGEARAMLLKLKISDPDCSPAILSGGQKKRAALAAAILTPCDLLILDEPTNHLDHDMIEWLQEWLESFKGALIMVTHDRYFLDEVTNRIWELDNGRLYSYQANYSGYLQKKQERLDFAKAKERKLATLYKQDLKWMLRGARARSTKQKAHIQRFEALRDREKLIEERQAVISSMASRLGRTTVELNNISKSYGEHVLFRDFSYIFLKTDRIGIIGPNGCGKSTLMKLIMGIEQPDSGSIEVGQTVKFGYFSQENENLDPKERVIDCVKDVAEYIRTDEGMITASAMCERFLFDSKMQYTRVDKLSGGEKRRLYLLKVLMSSPNVLILDEPTNDLDIVTLQILEDYLDSFAGIVIAVSHDRYFLDRVASRIFSFEPDGSIRQSEGGYEEYLMHREEWGLRECGTDYASASSFKKGNSNGGTGSASAKNPAEADNSSQSVVSGSTAENAVGSASDSSAAGSAKGARSHSTKKLSYKEQREYDSLESEIDRLSEKSDTLGTEIIKAASDYAKLRGLTEEKESVDAELDAKMERYFELQEKLEALQK